MKYNYYKDRDKSIEDILVQIKTEATPLDTDSFYLICNASRSELDYLKELDIIDYLKPIDDAFGVGLTTKGIELIAYYETWAKYKRKVLNKEKRKNNGDYWKLRLWWLPIFISVIALLIAIFKQ